MAREESSRSGARRPQSGIFVVSFLLCSSLSRSASWPTSALCCCLPGCFFWVSLSHTLKSNIWLQEEPENRHFVLTRRCSPSQTIYTDGGGVTHEKESPSLQERSRRMGHISRAVHTPATVNDFHPLAPSHSGLLTVKPGERGTHTFIINKGNICFTNQPSPDWSDVAAIFLCSL